MFQGAPHVDLSVEMLALPHNMALASADKNIKGICKVSHSLVLRVLECLFSLDTIGSSSHKR